MHDRESEKVAQTSGMQSSGRFPSSLAPESAPQSVFLTHLSPHVCGLWRMVSAADDGTASVVEGSAASQMAFWDEFFDLSGSREAASMTAPQTP